MQFLHRPLVSGDPFKAAIAWNWSSYKIVLVGNKPPSAFRWSAKEINAWLDQHLGVESLSDAAQSRREDILQAAVKAGTPAFLMQCKDAMKEEKGVVDGELAKYYQMQWTAGMVPFDR